MEKKKVSHFIAGLTTGAVYIILFVIYYYEGLAFAQNFWIVFAPYFISFAMIITAVALYGKSKNNFVTFGELFNYGFKTTSIFVLLVTVFMFFFVKYSGYKEQFEAQIANSIKNEVNLDSKKKQLALENKGSFVTLVIGSAIFTNVIIGALGSLTAAIFARKEAPVSPDK